MGCSVLLISNFFVFRTNFPCRFLRPQFFFSGSSLLKLFFFPSNPLFPLLLCVEGLGGGLWLRYDVSPCCKPAVVGLRGQRFVRTS